ncbi:hypothetical protein TRICI_003697 [Trichomonascus ciferrii]|uniref:Reverse transcriptase RNase H-like domain-containing protein n=1 Tax=Trichomonascus ciferrii TaxID=44093 RepID=A0A642V346_9ASCO|nr:hypothetical protein TRICI_003697 [Trichomonascus ciferrii]
MRKYLEEQKKAGFISPSTSKFASPMFFVQQKDKLRPVVDYRAVNNATIKNRYPHRNIRDMLDRGNVTNSVILSKIDLKSAYHQIRIRSGEEWKTAFTTPFGHFQYNVLPFGLGDVLDNILVFSESKEKHEEHLREVFCRLVDHGLIVNLEKCEFEKTSLDFLGHHVHCGGELFADSSDYATGATIVQWVPTENRWRPVAFLSQTLKDAQLRYHVHDEELLAIVRAFHRWRHYLLSCHERPVVVTDHKNLTYFSQKQQHLSDRQLRWAGFLSGFDFDLQYDIGANNTLADSLSRRDDPPERTIHERIVFPNNPKDPGITIRRTHIMESSLSDNDKARFRQSILADHNTRQIIEYL